MPPDVLRMGAKRAIQTRFYKYLYGKEIPRSVVDTDRVYCVQMGLTDIKIDDAITHNVNPTDDALLAPVAIDHIEPEKEVKPEKKNRKNKFQKKVKLMTIEELYTWATELGLSQEAIDKSKDKPSGLAKMYISNIIATALRKSCQLEWFSFDD